MQIVDKNIFFNIIQEFSYVPFNQSKGWWAYNTPNGQNRFVFYADSIEKPTIVCMGRTTKRFGLKMLQIEGECLRDKNDIDSKKIRDFYKEISKTNFDIIEINSSLPYSALYEIGIRQAGFLRPVGLFSTALTILLDLKKTINYDKNWQNNLRRAEKYNLVFLPVSFPEEKDFEDYFSIHNEMVNRKQFNDRTTASGLKRLFENDNFKLFFTENENNERIAGLIAYEQNHSAISIFSATSPEGRQKSASYYLRDKIYHFYQKQNYTSFDCGRISPAAHEKNKIFTFKDGVKGDYLLYCGEFSWYRKQFYRPLMYFVKKYLLKKIEL